MDYIYVFTYSLPWEDGDDDIHRYDFKVRKPETEIVKIKFLHVAGMVVTIKEKIKLYNDGSCIIVKGV